jgi:carboxyl-terminal processing protease
MKIKKKFSIVFFLLFLVPLFAIGLSYSNTTQTFTTEIFEEIPLFTDALTIVQKFYVRDVTAEQLIYGALKGMLAELDPYSEFLPPKKFEDIKSETDGEFGGVGLVVSVREQELTIITPMEETPAEKAGLKPGDIIVKIDGKSARDMGFSDAVDAMRGKPGTTVVLSVMRSGSDALLTFNVKRAKIEVESVKDAFLLAEKIGYVRIVDFGKKTRKLLHESISKLEALGAESLILDLRNNPGGLLDAAVDVANMFLPKGTLIVYTQNRAGEEELRFESKGMDYRAFKPLIVLINKGSASGSEIVAGAIKDTSHGIIIGETSFGKASVQTVIPLRDMSALRLTTAEYYTPSGITIHEKGIEPHIAVAYENPVLKELSEKKDELQAVRDEYVYNKEKRKELLLSDSHIVRALQVIKDKEQWPHEKE